MRPGGGEACFGEIYNAMSKRSCTVEHAVKWTQDVCSNLYILKMLGDIYNVACHTMLRDIQNIKHTRTKSSKNIYIYCLEQYI